MIFYRFKTNHSQILETFGNLEIGFSIKLKANVLEQLSIVPQLHYFFVEILTHYKTGSKQAISMRYTKQIVSLYVMATSSFVVQM